MHSKVSVKFFCSYVHRNGRIVSVFSALFAVDSKLVHLFWDNSQVLSISSKQIQFTATLILLHLILLITILAILSSEQPTTDEDNLVGNNLGFSISDDFDGITLNILNISFSPTSLDSVIAPATITISGDETDIFSVARGVSGTTSVNATAVPFEFSPIGLVSVGLIWGVSAVTRKPRKICVRC